MKESKRDGGGVKKEGNGVGTFIPREHEWDEQGWKLVSGMLCNSYLAVVSFLTAVCWIFLLSPTRS